MANKIKDIFSNDMFGVEGKIDFKDKESYENYLAKLEEVYNEGNAVEIEGVSSITTSISQNGMNFPFDIVSEPVSVVIAPSVEPVILSVKVNNENREMKFNRSETRYNVTLKSDPDAIVYFQLTLLKNEKKQIIKYEIQLEKAKTIDDIIDGFCLAEAFFIWLFEQSENPLDEKDSVMIQNIIKYFHNQQRFFERLNAISKEFNLSSLIDKIKDLTSEEQHAIDELYLLICEHKIVRLNGKFTYDETTSITFNDKTADLNVGNNLDLTYLETCEYSFLGQTVKIYTANLFTNLIIKDIRTESDGSTKVLYGDIDSKPMFVSFSAYKTEEEASEECKTIIEHVKDYKDAEYSNVYIQKYYSK